MDQWSFVAAAYAVALLLTAGLLAWGWASMSRAEAAAEAITRK